MYFQFNKMISAIFLFIVVYTACSEGKKALKLFWSINPKMDVPPQAMNSYDYANDQMRVFATVYLDVCVR